MHEFRFQEAVTQGTQTEPNKLLRLRVASFIAGSVLLIGSTNDPEPLRSREEFAGEMLLKFAAG